MQLLKMFGEAYCKSYLREHGLEYTIFRFFNTYGPNQSPDFVIPKFIELAKQNLPIPLYGIGNQTRTFCYIDDNTETIFRCLENHYFINETLNIGSDVELTIADLAAKIIHLSHSESKTILLPPLPEGDMTRRMPDITRMRSVLNRSLTDIDTGLKLTIDSNYKT
jgi:UDP-glucose 4-epimerase